MIDRYGDYMRKILDTIIKFIYDNRKLYLPHVKDEDLEENGTIYYMNGKNGTEFDWYVNEKVSDFFVFYNDERCMGAVKLTLYNAGDIRIYLYDEQGDKLVKEIDTFLDVSEEEVLKLAVLLKNQLDDKLIWDAKIENIYDNFSVTKEQIDKFKENAANYEKLIYRKKLYGMYCYVSACIIDDGWKVGYMVREESQKEEDSGWTFMAGNEDDEYLDNYKNIRILSIASMCQIDPDIVPHICLSEGSALIRTSSNQLEIDKNDREIYCEKRK